MKFLDLVNHQNELHNNPPAPKRLLCFDPGHTTGWAFFEDQELMKWGQIDTLQEDTAPRNLKELFTEFDPDMIVYEDYRVYRSKKEQHVGSDLRTTKVIGIIEALASFEFIPIHKQMAVVAKSFCKDKKLQEWGYYQKGMRHARDAIRHGCYYLIFRHMTIKGKAAKAAKLTVG